MAGGATRTRHAAAAEVEPVEKQPLRLSAEIAVEIVVVIDDKTTTEAHICSLAGTYRGAVCAVDLRMASAVGVGVFFRAFYIYV